MSVGQVLATHTRRQLKAQLAWIEDQWQKTDKVDWYLAQIAAEIRRGHVKKPRSVKLKHLLLKFRQDDVGAVPQLTKDQITAIQKTRWSRRLGVDLHKMLPVNSTEDLPDFLPGNLE